MSFRANGTAVVRTVDGEDVGYAMAFTADAAQRIADALNESSSTSGLRAVVDPLTGDKVDRLDVADRTPLAQAIGRGRYVKIVGPYATAIMDTPGGRQVRSMAEGSIVPGDVTAGHARHLIDVGLAQVVEAGSAVEAYEGAPTERHRVEMTSPDVNAPTVLTAAPGSPADDYDRDPIAAAQAAARAGGAAPVALTTGAGEAFGGTPETSARSGRPSVNEPKGVWVEYHVAQRPDHVDEATARQQAEAWTKDDLKSKAGREYPAADTPPQE
jgi:hypothetical protein